MAYSERSYSRGYLSFDTFPTGVKWLLIVNVAVFLLTFLSSIIAGPSVTMSFVRGLELYPYQVVEQGRLWQLVTYFFLHLDPMHLLGNMLALYFFGPLLERRVWGMKRFLQFYFLCGIGAGLCVVLAAYLTGGQGVPTLGASGAVYGVLLGGAMYFPDEIILFFLVYPLKLKHVAWIYGGLAFLGSLGAGSGVSHVAHLGGMIFGYFYIKSLGTKSLNGIRSSRVASNPLRQAQEWYKEWKLRRARKKFEVYMQKRQGDRDRWVN